MGWSESYTLLTCQWYMTFTSPFQQIFIEFSFFSPSCLTVYTVLHCTNPVVGILKRLPHTSSMTRQWFSTRRRDIWVTYTAILCINIVAVLPDPTFLGPFQIRLFQNVWFSYAVLKMQKKTDLLICNLFIRIFLYQKVRMRQDCFLFSLQRSLTVL